MGKLIQNSTLNPHIRKKIGETLNIYDPNKTNHEKYAILKESQSYECPDQEMLFLCSEYLEKQRIRLIIGGQALMETIIPSFLFNRLEITDIKIKQTVYNYLTKENIHPNRK